jgi:hypothetical protein
MAILLDIHAELDALTNFCERIYDSVRALDRSSTQDQVTKILAGCLLLNVQNPFDLFARKRIFLKIIDAALDNHSAAEKLRPLFRAGIKQILTIKKN